MASFSKGLLSGISGTIGNIVFASRNGKYYIRSRPKSSTTSATPAQRKQRLRFGMATRFLNNFSSLLALTFKDPMNGMSGTNKALSYILKYAIAGEYPNLKIDYESLRLSTGNLIPISKTKLKSVESGAQFTWKYDRRSPARASDKIILAAYNPASNKGFYSIGNAVRSSGTAVLDLPGLKGEMVETWIALMTENGKDFSNSEYTGRLILT